MKSVGERIRQARNAKGLSAEELAHRCGYKNQSAISNLENRATSSGGTRIARIAAELGVPIEWLLQGPDGPTVPFTYKAATVAPAVMVSDNTVRYGDWPFPTATRARLDAMLAKLAPPLAKQAISDLDKHLDVLLERWEKEAARAQETRPAA